MPISANNYGYLPQLRTFDVNASVPTATVNIMAAMALNVRAEGRNLMFWGRNRS